MEEANFCVVMDTLVDQAGGSKLLCSNGYLANQAQYEVANFCTVMDTLVDQDGGSKFLWIDGHLGRSLRWR